MKELTEEEMTELIDLKFLEELGNVLIGKIPNKEIEVYKMVFRTGFSNGLLASKEINVFDKKRNMKANVLKGCI